MSVARVKKIQLLAHCEAHMKLLASLQEEGLIHIEKTDVEDGGLDTSVQDVVDLDHWLYKLDQAIDFLSQWQEKSLADKLSGKRPEVSMRERDKALDLEYRQVLAEVDKLESDRSSLLGRIRFLGKEREGLLPLESLDLCIREVTPTETTQVRIGAVPASRWPGLESLAESEPLFVDVICRDKRHVSVVLLVWGKAARDLDPALKELEFNPDFFSEVVLDLAEEEDKIADVIAKISQEIEDARRALEASQDTGRRLAAEKLDDLMRVHDVLYNEREKGSPPDCWAGPPASFFWKDGSGRRTRAGSRPGSSPLPIPWSASCGIPNLVRSIPWTWTIRSPAAPSNSSRGSMGCRRVGASIPPFR